MKSCLFSGRNSVTPISLKLIILETAGPLHRALSLSPVSPLRFSTHIHTHKQSQSQRILHYPLDQSTSQKRVYLSHLNHAANILPFSLLNFTVMMEELTHWQLVAEHVCGVSHFLTNYHKRGGLTVISGTTFQNVYTQKEKVGEQRVNCFLSVIVDEWVSTWDLL